MSTLISYVGRDKAGHTQFGQALVGCTEWNNTNQLIRGMFEDGWTTLRARDLDRGVQCGAIEIEPASNTRIWWAL